MMPGDSQIIDEPRVLVIRKALKETVAAREASYDPSEDRYGKDWSDCALEACGANGINPLLAPLLWLAACHFFNDAQEWADGIYDEDLR